MLPRPLLRLGPPLPPRRLLPGRRWISTLRCRRRVAHEHVI
jgi:hypothetical protein